MWRGGWAVNHLSSGRWLIICEGAAMRIFYCGNLWIEWRLTAMWGDDSPLCLFCLYGDLLALSYRSASFLQGSSLPLSTRLHLHGNQSLCRSGIRLGRGEKKSLISPFLIHAYNATQQPTKSWGTERQHTPCCCEGEWMGEQGGTGVVCSCGTHETFHLHLLYVCRPWEWGLTLASQNPAAWHWPPLFF